MRTAPSIQPETHVADILKAFPKTAKVFIALRTDCVGCMAARFCTLQNVAGDYQLDLGHLMAELRAVVQPSHPPTEETCQK